MSVFLLVALIAIINTTNIHFGLFFLGQPFVLGGILGLLLNDMTLGLYVGAVLQLMWIRSIPIGVKVQTNYTLITFLIIYFIYIFDSNLYPIIFFVAYIFATLAKYLEKLIKKINSYIVDYMLKKLSDINFELFHLVYLILYTCIFFLFFLIAFYGTHFIVLKILFYIPEKMLMAFQSSYHFLILYAFSLLYRTVSFKFKILYFVAGLGVGILLIFFHLPFLISLLILIFITFFVALLDQQKILYLVGK